MENLPDNELCLILTRLDGRSFTAANCVCKQWSRVSNSIEVRKQRFLRQWGLKAIVGLPRSSSFLETATLGDFVKRHAVQSGDTLTKLAVKYSCSRLDLKMTNNILSEHAIMSRKEVLFKVASREDLRSQLGQFYYSAEAKREYICVFPPDHVFEESATYDFRESRKRLMQSASLAADRVRKQLVLMMCRQFMIDELVAESYLALADWDPLLAIEQYNQDAEWQGGN